MKFKVGDMVKVNVPNNLDGSLRDGAVGVIDNTDSSGFPYRVRFPGNKAVFYKEEELTREESKGEPLISELAEWCERLINETCDQECPHCQRMLNLPDSEQIENWLKGEK